MAKRKKIESQRGIRPRSTNIREPRQRFLIVCEGTRTEPNYFRAFRVAGHIKGEARQALQLVQRAIEIRDESDDEYDQVWCVFDRDDVPRDQFNEAIALAKRAGINVACSNQAFELWYLLHFHYYNSAITREDYKQQLSKLPKRPYRKNNELIYDVLVSRQTTALTHARNLLATYQHVNYVDNDPSTTVHLLVEELIKHQA